MLQNKSENGCQTKLCELTDTHPVYVYKARFLTAVCTNGHYTILTVPLQDTQIVIATYLFQNPVTFFFIIWPSICSTRVMYLRV